MDGFVQLRALKPMPKLTNQRDLSRIRNKELHACSSLINIAKFPDESERKLRVAIILK